MYTKQTFIHTLIIVGGDLSLPVPSLPLGLSNWIRTGGGRGTG